MSELHVEQAKEAIRVMNREERKRVKGYLVSLMALGKNVPDPAPDNQIEDVVGLVNSTLHSLGFEFLPHDKLRGFCKDYNNVAARLWAFARAAMPYDQRAQHMALLRLGVQMLTKNIQQNGIPVTHANVMRQLERLPGVINQGFPGYAAVGLLGMVIRERTGERLHA